MASCKVLGQCISAWLQIFFAQSLALLNHCLRIYQTICHTYTVYFFLFVKILGTFLEHTHEKLSTLE